MAEEVQQSSPQDQIILDLANRLRVLESKNSMLGERLLLVNENMIKEYKKLIKEIKSLEVELKDIKSNLNNVKNVLKHLTQDASNFARKDSLKVLEKYINLWNPFNFVTEQEVLKLIKSELNKKGESNATKPNATN